MVYTTCRFLPQHPAQSAQVLYIKFLLGRGREAIKVELGGQFLGGRRISSYPLFVNSLRYYLSTRSKFWGSHGERAMMEARLQWSCSGFRVLIKQDLDV
jgi:hypothetical protein